MIDMQGTIKLAIRTSYLVQSALFCAVHLRHQKQLFPHRLTMRNSGVTAAYVCWNKRFLMVEHRG